MGQLDVLLNAQSKQTPGLVPPKATSGGGGLDILLKQGVKVPVSTPTIVAPPTVETQKKSLYQQISLLVENKLNGVFPGREEMGKIAEERRKASGKTAVRELISTIPSVYEPVTRYVKDTAKIAVNAISGAGKLTPAYLFYRAVTGKPVTPKEYLSNNLSTGMETLSTLWRLNPVAPAFGSTLATVKALRQKAQGKDITWDDILDAPIKGTNEQPGVGEAFTDNAKWAQAIDTIFLVGMFTRGAFKKGPKGEPSFAQRKLNKINLRAEELNQVSKTLEVKPGASLGKIGQAFKNKIKQIPDAFTSNPSPVSAARRVELTNAFNILKKAGVVEKKYAQAYEFLVSKFGRKGIKPPGVSGIVEAPERPLSGEGPVSPVAGKIEPSVLQIKDTKTGAIEYKTIPQGQLSEFKALIDTGTKGEVGIAGKEIDGKVYHLTAKTPEQMNEAGARFMGEAKIEEVPVQPKGVEEVLPEEKISGVEKLPTEAQPVLDEIKGALFARDEDAARSIYNDLSKEVYLPSFETIKKGVARGEDRQRAITTNEGVEAIKEKYGSYGKVVGKMKNFLRISADKRGLDNLLFREHIPESI